MSMFVFIPGLPQRITMVPDPNTQSAQPYWTMIEVGEWYLVDSKMSLDTLAISQRISPTGVVSIQSEIDYQSTPASPEGIGLLGREVHVSNYVFQLSKYLEEDDDCWCHL
jgi:hypothetical protein